ncbi:TRAP transporter large permease [Oceanibacterium hippocampi]|uniref:TRAP transporter large permease protein n=1 Tax=Oceanibacterium hippocampi TaxID=745714 RepID=A0A1Y5TRG5_9PROT|nr:TRAP transporter large permease [Oceanibacterium hippocampi]SLN66407.1 Sialic acid TRAP transporter permease protein SiaT [Oceanibacterium hippocampi]
MSILSLMAVLGALGLLVFGAPIWVVIGLPSALYILVDGIPPELIVQRMFNSMDQFLLLALPLFMLAGEIMNAAGLTHRLVELARALMGRMRAGLAMVNLGTNLMMAGMSGSALADASAIATLMTPRMAEHGYRRSFVAAITAAGSIVGPIIPPSVVFILYGVLAEVSVIDLFLAGIVPGFLIVVFQMVVVQIQARRGKLPDERQIDVPPLRPSLIRAIPVLIMPIVIVGGIRGGVFTPIEGAAVAVGYGVVVALFLRSLSFADAYKSLLQVGRSVGEILLMIASASLLSWILVSEQVPHSIAGVMETVTTDPFVLLLVINLVLLLVGMFLDNFAAMVIFVPFFLPMIQKYGIDPVHFGVVLNVNLMIGAITPPVGLCLFVTSRIARIPFEDAAREVLPFLFASIAALLVITFVPALSLTIPMLFK